MKKPILDSRAVHTPTRFPKAIPINRNCAEPNVHKEFSARGENRLQPAEWNALRKNFPAKCIHELFETQAERSPQAPAVWCGAESLTYAELNHQANLLARWLIQKGVGPDSLIGICMHRSIEMVIAIFAVLKSGGAFVPLDPEYPAERLEFMLRDAAMPLVLAHRDTEEIIRTTGVPFLCVERAPEIEAQSGENPPRHSEPHHLAYVIYTSGSTGQPKGVMISHDALCNHTFWMQGEFPLEPGDRLLQKTSLCFDASIWEIFSPLSFGAQLFLAKGGWHRDVGYLAREICRQKITCLQMVPSVLRLLLLEPQFKECKSLRRLFCGGEALSADLVRRVHSILDTTIINLYGPTEATINSTFWICPREETPDVIPIGKPITNTAVHLLNAQNQPVAHGEPGELCIGGRSLARCYLSRPKLTAQRFIPNPFSSEPGARLYKSGDLARWLPDGTLEFLGRADSQVKIRGHRIEPCEVETALRNHPAICEAVVLGRDDTPGDKRLVGYVKAPKESAPGASELRAFLKTKLPEHMIPSAFVTLEKFPRTPSGKIDRHALPAPSRAMSSAKTVSPPTPMEKDVAAIWCEVFHLENIGVEDSFFDLGGHSLLAMQILIRVREMFGVELSLPVIFEGATVRHVAEAISREKQTAGSGRLEDILAGISETRHDRATRLSTQATEQTLPERIS